MPTCLKFAFDQRDGVANDVGRLDVGSVRLGFAREAFDATDDLTGPIGLVGNAVKRVGQFPGVSVLSRSQFCRGQFGSHDDGRQRLVQFVRDAAGHLFNRPNSRDMSKLLAMLLHSLAKLFEQLRFLLLGLYLIGDVAHHSHDAAHSPRFVMNRVRACRQNALVVGRNPRMLRLARS